MHKPSVKFKPASRFGKQLVAVMMGAAFIITSCKKDDDETTTPAPTDNNGGVSAVDKAFMDSVSRGNMAEIGAGRLAVERSADSNIRAFGQMMINDHTAMQNELSTLASAKGTTPDTALDAEHKAMKMQLQMMSGWKFDSAYIAGQVKDHDATLRLLQNIQAKSQDQDMKNLAAKADDKVMVHRQHAVDLRDSVLTNKR